MSQIPTSQYTAHLEKYIDEYYSGCEDCSNRGRSPLRFQPVNATHYYLWVTEGVLHGTIPRLFTDWLWTNRLTLKGKWSFQPHKFHEMAWYHDLADIIEVNCSAKLQWIWISENHATRLWLVSCLEPLWLCGFLQASMWRSHMIDQF